MNVASTSRRFKIAVGVSALIIVSVLLCTAYLRISHADDYMKSTGTGVVHHAANLTRSRPDGFPFRRADNKPYVPGLQESEYRFLRPYPESSFLPNPARFGLSQMYGGGGGGASCLEQLHGDLRKIVYVIAAHDEDTEWAEQLPGPYRRLVYSHNTASKYHYPENVGHEVVLFLKYQLDFWDCLPEFTIFLHGHGPSNTWHGPTILEQVREVVSAIENGTFQHGYWNLNYAESVEGKPYKNNPVLVKPPAYLQPRFLEKSWDALYRSEFGPSMPPFMHSYCCLQLALHRSRIRMRPRAFWERLMRWVVNFEIGQYCCEPDPKIGDQRRLMEFWAEHTLEVYLPWIWGEPHDVKLREGCDGIYLPCV